MHGLQATRGRHAEVYLTAFGCLKDCELQIVSMIEELIDILHIFLLLKIPSSLSGSTQNQ